MPGTVGLARMEHAKGTGHPTLRPESLVVPPPHPHPAAIEHTLMQAVHAHRRPAHGAKNAAPLLHPFAKSPERPPS